MRTIVPRKGRRGLAKAAKPDGAKLCGLGVSFALFAGNFKWEGEKSLPMYSKALVLSQLTSKFTLT
jgi:hypothetical protein